MRTIVDIVGRYASEYEVQRAIEEQLSLQALQAESLGYLTEKSDELIAEIRARGNLELRLLEALDRIDVLVAELEALR